MRRMDAPRECDAVMCDVTSVRATSNVTGDVTHDVMLGYEAKL
jgi:hypothetical protein